MAESDAGAEVDLSHPPEDSAYRLLIQVEVIADVGIGPDNFEFCEAVADAVRERILAEPATAMKVRILEFHPV